MEKDRIKELREQIDRILSRNKDNEEFLRWAALRLKTVERWQQENR